MTPIEYCKLSNPEWFLELDKQNNYNRYVQYIQNNKGTIKKIYDVYLFTLLYKVNQEEFFSLRIIFWLYIDLRRQLIPSFLIFGNKWHVYINKQILIYINWYILYFGTNTHTYIYEYICRTTSHTAWIFSFVCLL